MRRAAVSTLLVIALAACGGDSGAEPSDPPVSDGPSGDPVLVIAAGDPDGPGMSVADAMRHGPTDDVVAVTGALFVDPDGTVRLCDAIAESYPPQCAGERIVVEGLDLTSIPDLRTDGQVGWAESVTLLGSVE